ncbi:MAG: ClpXP protease specificity-enhancing factor [Burkholderiales bacterium]
MSDVTTKPYLIRAIYEWCSDNGYTPYLAVQVSPRTQVPLEHVKDGQIVLSLSSTAVRNLLMGNEFVEFSARFSGTARQILVPIASVIGIYARENGQGLFFAAEEETEQADAEARSETPTADKPGEPNPPRGRPSLKIVK